jgi:cell division septal protein FtsQ
MIFRSKNKIPKRTLGAEDSAVEKIRLSRVLFYVLIFIFGAVSVYVLFFSSFLQIKKVVVRGLEELKYEKVMSGISATLDQKYFGLIVQNNILLARSVSLESALKNDFKKISSVKIEKVFPDTLIVSIQERKGLLVWCSGEDCVMVDERGSAYAPADFNSPEVAENNLIVVRDQSQSSILSDRVTINPEIVNFLLVMRKETKDRLGLDLNREFETPRSVSGDIVATTGEGWKIMLNYDLGAVKEVEMLQIVLDQNIGKEKRADLEYVDLRTEGKVYYKLKNTAPEEPADKDEE